RPRRARGRRQWPRLHAHRALHGSVRQRVDGYHDGRRRALIGSEGQEIPMGFIARRAGIPASLMCIATLTAGCAHLAGIEDATCSVRHVYACKCACTGGGQTFSLNNDVCLPESLNPALNPHLPPDFVPTSDDIRQDCETRVESNLEQMARQCVADRIRCSCAGIAEPTPSCNDCDSPCAGEDLAADCSNFDPQAGAFTATNVPGKPPVCISGQPWHA